MKSLLCACILIAGSAAAQEAEVALPSTLDLETAQRIALRENPALQAAAARVEQAKDRVAQARSRYYPQVEASYSASHTWLSDKVVDQQRGLIAQQAAIAGASRLQQQRAAAAFEDTANSFQLGVTAAYVIFDGFSRKFSNAAARFGTQEAEAGRQEAQRLLLDAVARTFYDGVQLARENVEIAKADMAFNERQLKDAEAMKRVGRGSLSNVLNFEVQIRAARAAVLQGENDYAIARVALAALMGLPDAALGDDVEIALLEEESAAVLTSPVLEEALAASTARPDLALARHGVERAEAQLGARKSVYYPQVSAFASQNYSRTDNNGFDESDGAATVGLQVSYELFAGGRNRASVSEARHALDEAERNLTDAELNARSEVRQAVLDVLTAEEQVKLQRETAGYVEQNRDLVEKAYRAGGAEASLTRLNQAQRDLTEAQGRLAQARVALRQAWHALRTATGETLAAFAPVTE